jgi:hypothetical protein
MCNSRCVQSSGITSAGTKRELKLGCTLGPEEAHYLLALGPVFGEDLGLLLTLGPALRSVLMLLGWALKELYYDTYIIVR